MIPYLLDGLEGMDLLDKVDLLDGMDLPDGMGGRIYKSMAYTT